MPKISKNKKLQKRKDLVRYKRIKLKNFKDNSINNRCCNVGNDNCSLNIIDNEQIGIFIFIFFKFNYLTNF